jgi:hypothetical protein
VEPLYFVQWNIDDDDSPGETEFCDHLSFVEIERFFGDLPGFAAVAATLPDLAQGESKSWDLGDGRKVRILREDEPEFS